MKNCTISKHDWYYALISLNIPVEELQLRSIINSLMFEALGLAGQSISCDILKTNNNDAIIRVPYDGSVTTKTPFTVRFSVFDNCLLLSVNEAAIYQFNIDHSNSPSNSWSLPQKFILNTPATTFFKFSTGGTMEDEETDLPSRFYNPVYAVLNSKVDLNKNDQNKVIAQWNTDLSKGSTTVKTQASHFKQFSKAIANILPTSCNHLILINTDGSVTVTASDLSLSEKLVEFTPESEGFGGKLLYSKILESINSNNVKNSESFTRILTVSESLTDSKVLLRFISVSIKSKISSIKIEETANTYLDVDIKKKNYIFCINDKLRNFLVGDSQEVKVYQVRWNGTFGKTITSDLIIPLPFYNQQPSICFMALSYIAVLGHQKTDNGWEDVLTVFDSTYGTIQSQKVVSAGPSSKSTKKSYHMEITNSPSQGSLLLCTITDSSENGLISSFKTSCNMIPYHATELSLLVALGKGQKSLNFEDKLILQLSDSLSTTTTVKYEELFLKFLQSRYVENSDKQYDDICTFPTVEIKHNEIQAISSRIFGHLSKQFYPNSVIIYLLNTGMMSTKFDGGSIVAELVKSNDVKLSTMAIGKCPDVTENDIILTLELVVKQKEIGFLKRSNLIASLLSKNRNDHLMIQEMAKLDINFVLEMLNWIEDTVGDDLPMEVWWLPKGKKNRIELAVDLFSILIDAQYAFLIMETNIHSRILSLRHIILNYKECCFLMETKLRGALSSVHFELKDNAENKLKPKDYNYSNKGSKKSTDFKEKGKKWERMVGDVTDGVGHYAVEVFKLD
ncbi:hypothetical protein HK099_005583 [Clydaea vesicula]|uniref:Ribonucleases P/MRP subunit Pop8-like domain-containing protein n=1 Tax=Clydaea vesicula TaxID=447962 RepID=A0AAD5U2A8_9FUNG|nr:hypothetical protein HK099_005583 [Clydaea vesicula]